MLNSFPIFRDFIRSSDRSQTFDFITGIHHSRDIEHDSPRTGQLDFFSIGLVEKFH